MKEKSQELIDMILYQSNIDNETYSSFSSSIRDDSCVALHFHPDRLTARGLTVAESLNQTGYYKSLFETNISSGSVTAFGSGLRDKRESDVFGMASIGTH